MPDYIAQDTDFTLVANAIRTKTGDSGLLEWPSGFKTAIDNIVDTDCIKTVGPAPVVSVTDAAPLDAEDVMVGIGPIQDLHGYDSPWPAGGGVNKFAIGDAVGLAVKSACYNLDVDIDAVNETIRIHGTPSWTTSGTYSFRAIVTEAGYWGTTPVDHDYTGYNVFTETVSKSSNITSNPYLFVSSYNTISIADLTVSDTNAVDITFRLSLNPTSTPTEWTPYSNICPITGWTGANVTRTGKNLLDYSVFQQYANWSDSIVTYGVYPTSSGNKGYLLPVVSGMTYTVSLGISSSSFPTFCYICRANGDDTSERVQSFTTGSFSTASITFTAESGWIYYVRIGSTTTESAFTTQMEKVSSAQLELGSTATDYEPYQGNTYDITFPTPPGTVYGGTLNVTSGVLTVDRAMVDMGTLTWRRRKNPNSDLSDTYVFYATVSSNNPPKSSFSGITSAYKWVVNYIYMSNDKTAGFIYNASVCVRDDDYTDADAFKTAMSGVQLVYELATPITYQLTPQEIALLRGNNALWADTGDTMLKYFTTAFEDLAEEIGFADGGDY